MVSTTWRDLLSGPVVAVRVFAAVSGAVYLRSGGAVLAIVQPDAAHLPMAAIVPGPVSAELRPGRTGQLGDGVLQLARLRLTVGRWWDPTPLLGDWRTAALRTGTAVLDDLLGPASARVDLPSTGPATVADLGWALQDGDEGAFLTAAAALVGLGPGLTPAGDDVLVGLLSALACLGDGRAAWAPTLVAAAAGRTTDLSSALLGHAAAGRCYGEVAALLVALTGGSGVRRAAARLVAVGQSSGPALAHGVLLGARACATTGVTGT